jgi:hypothetical protein
MNDQVSLERIPLHSAFGEVPTMPTEISHLEGAVAGRTVCGLPTHRLISSVTPWDLVSTSCPECSRNIPKHWD